MSLLRAGALDHLDTSRTKTITLYGVYVPDFTVSDKPVTLDVRYIGDDPRVINAYRKADASFTAETTARERFDALLPLFAEIAVVGWANVLDGDGQPVPFYAAGVVEIMTAYADKAIDLAAQTVTYPTFVRNFRELAPPKLDAAALGKE